MSRPHIALISAIASNGVIGIDNKMPWHVPEDLKRFKALTMGAPMLMGRKTFESLPGLLPGRRHLVISRNAGWQAPGAEVFASIDAALAACEGAQTAFVIGGGEIYRQTLPMADTLYLTEVALAPVGDATFPDIGDGWHESAREAHTSTNGTGYSFVTYQRVV
ncbi:Dihydrofolate reductase type 3 [Andreprevotia sp. IGB-42]|uniref:dihydrofolate reductase n=1 Tax=Andreprevotia sp. IGB-42 TaxID=2497473 RepID=UPI00135A47E5|nr:dihydrofolate reductase [Andreprevotia sp. IGB-42]KAF0811674.1 Dihydrofolate reductase type 3 [Andreprevotia sp. IGB-42]